MQINKGDRVQAIHDSERTLEGDFYFSANDQGVVLDINQHGAWVQWDDNHLSDGIWHASFYNLKVIQ